MSSAETAILRAPAHPPVAERTGSLPAVTSLGVAELPEAIRRANQPRLAQIAEGIIHSPPESIKPVSKSEKKQIWTAVRALHTQRSQQQPRPLSEPQRAFVAENAAKVVSLAYHLRSLGYHDIQFKEESGHGVVLNLTGSLKPIVEFAVQTAVVQLNRTHGGSDNFPQKGHADHHEAILFQNGEI